MIYTIETLKAGLSQINQTMLHFIQGLIVAWIIQAVVCAILSANIAKEKGYNPYMWAAIGALFGFFALIALIALPSKRIDQCLPRVENDLKEMRFLLRRIENHLDIIAGKMTENDRKSSPDDELPEDE